MQISALEVWHVNNEENNSQMCSLESGSADENIETMKAYMCKQRGMHLGSKISREEITKKVNQSKYEKYCYITNRLRREGLYIIQVCSILFPVPARQLLSQSFCISLLFSLFSLHLYVHIPYTAPPFLHESS